MSDPATSAELLLRLYDLRREAKMREARDWFIGAFRPGSAAEIMKVLEGEDSPKLRMVVSYWDMAASFVVRGAIDPEMFRDVSGEMLAVFAKVEPYLDDLREMTGMDDFLARTAAVVDDWPGAEERMEQIRRRIQEQAAA